MRRLPIGVSMIAGAEVRRIAAALESVAGWTEEVVVVLNEEVQDGTEEVALRHGARVYREPWKGHIRQKNSALEKVGQPWVLGLDCDEVVTPRLRASMEALFGDAGRLEGRAAYRFARCTQYGGRWIRHGDWYPDWQTRLWKRGRGRWGGVDPHDRLEVDGGVGTLDGELEHYSFEDMAQHVTKALRYAEVFERECAARGRSVTALDVVFRPPWRFVRSYFLRMGMLDGWAGFDVAWMSAFYTYLRYQRAHAARRRVDKG